MKINNFFKYLVLLYFISQSYVFAAEYGTEIKRFNELACKLKIFFYSLKYVEDEGFYKKVLGENNDLIPTPLTDFHILQIWHSNFDSSMRVQVEANWNTIINCIINPKINIGSQPKSEESSLIGNFFDQNNEVIYYFSFNDSDYNIRFVNLQYFKNIWEYYIKNQDPHPLPYNPEGLIKLDIIKSINHFLFEDDVNDFKEWDDSESPAKKLKLIENEDDSCKRTLHF